MHCSRLLRLLADCTGISERVAGFEVVDFVHFHFVALGFRGQAIRDGCPVLTVSFSVQQIEARADTER